MSGPQALPAKPQRLFFALWPAPPLAASLADTAVRLVAGCGGRATRCETLHLTLAFLGETPAERLAEVCAAGAAAAAAATSPFEFELDSIGWWKHNRIVWAGCAQRPGHLLELARGLGRELQHRGLPGAVKDFAPHVTLLRKATRPPSGHSLATQRWPVGEMLLVSSVLAAGGAAYRRVARWSLGGLA